MVLGVEPLRADAEFIRGDVDGSGTVLLNDAVQVLGFLFQRTDAVTCLDAADADDDGRVAISDAVFLLASLFARGPIPPAPFPDCGVDPTDDELDCVFQPCAAHVRFGDLQVPAAGAFYVVDRSSSMGDSGELAIAKRVLGDSIAALDDGMLFAIVAFDASTVRFGPVPADRVMRTTARSWLAEMSIGAGSCVGAGLMEALQVADDVGVVAPAILYIGDGGGTGPCGGIEGEQQYLTQTLDEVAERNAGRAAIHALGVLMHRRTMQETFLRTLVERNRGEYARVE